MQKNKVVTDKIHLENSDTRVLNMNEERKKKRPFYKKVSCFCIFAMVAVYCFPELQDKLISGLEFLKDEWRKLK